MPKRYGRFYVDWWTIRRSTIYGSIALVVLLAAVGVGGWFLVKNNFFLSDSPSVQYPPDSARLSSYEGDVRIIRAATRQMEKVSGETYLVAGDILQTQADGRANVLMADGSTLVVRPNSTVVIRSNAGAGSAANVRVALGGGQINVKTEDMAPETQNVVEVRQVENRLTARTDASFGINPTTNTGEIRVSHGIVQALTSLGEALTIKDSEYTSVNENGKLTPKERLLEPPKLIAPAPLERVLTGDSGIVDIALRWQKITSLPVAHYRVEVASSPFFVGESVLLQQEPVAPPNLTLADVKNGTYFWRVRALANSGQVGEWSEPLKFTVVSKDEGEILEVSNWQVDKVGTGVYLISGRANPGASVRIQGRETFALGDGNFRLQISTPGAQAEVIVSDEHGKRTRFRLALDTAKAIRLQ
jgi:prepilin-type processing-associated H-X9-DG protein